MQQEKPYLVLLGSARQDSHTRFFTDLVFGETEHTVIDLNDYTVFPYNYAEQYPGNDRFDQIIQEILNHDILIFSTPVYWYAMSGLMKQFFDRFTDLIRSKKQLGRLLKGKSVFLLSVGDDPVLPNGFEVPFSLTAGYLDMYYRGSVYFCSGRGIETSSHNIRLKEDFLQKIRLAEKE